jgi:uncharacterized membrane protein
MDAFLLEWGGLLLRWLHIVTAMAWIGASFFFMHLDASLRASQDIPQGQGGAAWQVHGGGFYEMRKYFVAPATLPEELTWHKWQAYWTWISGFVLLCWIYYAQASLYLVDPAVMALAGWQAALVGIGGLALGWVVYDRLCKSPLGKNDGLLAAVGFAFVVFMSWVFSQVFSGRGAMIHTGALMATMMTANVAMVIMPNQRKVIAALTAGEKPDARYGKEAKQRSTHNNYITLPVIFMMISNHYPMVWMNSATIPLVTALVLLGGGLVRHFYNVRHADHAKSPWWAWAVAAVAALVAFYVALSSSPAGRERLGLAPAPVPAVAVAAAAATVPKEAVEIVTGRCAMCHAAEPVWDGIGSPPKGVMLDTAERIAQQAAAIRMQSVLTHAMPPNNLTEMTPAERRVLAAWLNGPR